ncbi:MAG: ABC transporter substrate-binding protein [Patescibacteria group bacterium]
MRSSSLFFLGFLLLATITGAALFTDLFRRSTPQKQTHPKIVYGWNLWPGALPSLVAYEKGFFREEGLDVDLKLVKEYRDLITNLEQGRVTYMGELALIDALERTANGQNFRVVSATDFSSGADGIVASPAIQDVKALKYKRVAVEKSTLGEYLLRQALTSAGLSLQDLTVVDLPASEAAEAFIQGEVSAAVTFEPHLSRALSASNGHLIFTSAQTQNLITDVTVFQKNFVDQYPETVQAVVRATLKATEYIKQYPEESFVIGGRYFSITPEAFQAQFRGIQLYDLQQNRNYFSYTAGPDSIFQHASSLYSFLVTSRVIDAKNTFDLDALIDPRFIMGVTRH